MLQAIDPYDPAGWRAGFWQVDSPTGGFVAVRSLDRPPADAGLRPK